MNNDRHVPATLLVLLLTLMLTSMLSGCALFRDDCEGPNCDTPQLLDNKETKKYWYCYGQPDETWECRNKADPGLIKRPPS